MPDQYAKIETAGVQANTFRQGNLVTWMPYLTIVWGERPSQLLHQYEFRFDPPEHRAPESALNELRKVLGSGEMIEIPNMGIECRLIQHIVAVPGGEEES